MEEPGITPNRASEPANNLQLKTLKGRLRRAGHFLPSKLRDRSEIDQIAGYWSAQYLKTFSSSPNNSILSTTVFITKKTNKTIVGPTGWACHYFKISTVEHTHIDWQSPPSRMVLQWFALAGNYSWGNIGVRRWLMLYRSHYMHFHRQESLRSSFCITRAASCRQVLTFHARKSSRAWAIQSRPLISSFAQPMETLSFATQPWRCSKRYWVQYYRPNTARVKLKMPSPPLLWTRSRKRHWMIKCGWVTILTWSFGPVWRTIRCLPGRSWRTMLSVWSATQYCRQSQTMQLRELTFIKHYLDIQHMSNSTCTCETSSSTPTRRFSASPQALARPRPKENWEVGSDLVGESLTKGPFGNQIQPHFHLTFPTF